MTDKTPKHKAIYYEADDLYGFVHPIVYNETVMSNKVSLVNTDTSALDKDLHSKEAMKIAEESLGEDIN